MSWQTGEQLLGWNFLKQLSSITIKISAEKTMRDMTVIPEPPTHPRDTQSEAN